MSDRLTEGSTPVEIQPGVGSGEHDAELVYRGRRISELPERVADDLTGDEEVAFAADGYNGKVKIASILSGVNIDVSGLRTELVGLVRDETRDREDDVASLREELREVIGNTDIADEDNLQTQITSLNRDLGTLRSQVVYNTNNITGLGMLKADKSQLTAINQSIDGLGGDLDSLEGRVSTFEETLTTHDGRITGNDRNIRSLDNALCVLQESHGILSDDVDEIQGHVDDNARNIIRLDSTKANKTDVAAATSELSEQLSTATGKLATNIQNVNALKQRATQHEESIAELSTTKADAADVTALETRVAANEDSVSALLSDKIDKNSIVVLTEADYEGLADKDPDVFYFIYEEE